MIQPRKYPPHVNAAAADLIHENFGELFEVEDGFVYDERMQPVWRLIESSGISNEAVSLFYIMTSSIPREFSSMRGLMG